MYACHHFCGNCFGTIFITLARKEDDTDILTSTYRALVGMVLFLVIGPIWIPERKQMWRTIHKSRNKICSTMFWCLCPFWLGMLPYLYLAFATCSVVTRLDRLGFRSRHGELLAAVVLFSCGVTQWCWLPRSTVMRDALGSPPALFKHSDSNMYTVWMLWNNTISSCVHKTELNLCQKLTDRRKYHNII